MEDCKQQVRTSQRTERFRKSYKYKHKQVMHSIVRQQINCDTLLYNFRPTQAHLYIIIAIFNIAITHQVAAFCPLKCACNDLELWANCTQVQSISHVPMTLNPLLKRLTLARLPLSELSNSLALYRQVEVLNLNGNQLRTIKYENFNFKSAPKVINLSVPLISSTTSQQSSSTSQLMARHFKHSIDKQLGATDQQTTAGSSASTTDSIRFHLRQLELADNKLEQLGDYRPSAQSGDFDGSTSQQQQQQQHQQQQQQLKAHELERMAPFLTLARLELLNLSGNKLTRLHQHVFLGLSRLRQLDLARNQLEFLDQRALVGLVELEWLSLASNRLARHQPQFAHLGRSLCLGPLMELRQLDLSWNSLPQLMSAEDGTNQANILPSQMFACAPRLVKLELRGLSLKYVQAGALEQLVELKSLDLSENLFELVPFSSQEDLLQAATEELQMNSTEPRQRLVELKLSQTLIEFVSAHSLSARSLSQLERLEMRSMPQLVSFDLASLQSARRHLKQLLLDHNARLQSFHSSSNQRLAFTQLQLIDLNNAHELRQVQLDRMLDLAALTSQADSAAPLQVDISQANNLNCSSCQMAWLIDSFKQRRLPSAGHALPQLAPRPQPGWSPIPFDPYAAWPLPARPLPAASAQLPSQRRQLTLVNSDLINCAWPFSMPLIELINLETNYAPLFGVDSSCIETTSGSRVEFQPALNLQQQQQQQQPLQPLQPLQPPPLPPRQPFPQHQNSHTGGSPQPEVGLLTSAALLLAGLLAAGALVVVLFRLRRHIVARRGRRDGGKLATSEVDSESPSFTATTSMDSPQSSSTGSGRPHPPLLIRNPLAAAELASRQPPADQSNHYYYYVPAASVQKSSQTLQKVSRVNNAPTANHLSWRTGPTIATMTTTRTTNTNNNDNCRSFVDRNEEIKVRGNLFLRFVERLSAATGGGGGGGGATRRQSPAFDFSAALAANATPLRLPPGRGGAPLYSTNYTDGLLTYAANCRANLPAHQLAPIYLPTGRSNNNNNNDSQADNHYSICDDDDDHDHDDDDDTQLQPTDTQLRNDNYTNGHHRHHLNQLQTMRDDYVTSAGGHSRAG